MLHFNLIHNKTQLDSEKRECKTTTPPNSTILPPARPPASPTVLFQTLSTSHFPSFFFALTGSPQQYLRQISWSGCNFPDMHFVGLNNRHLQLVVSRLTLSRKRRKTLSAVSARQPCLHSDHLSSAVHRLPPHKCTSDRSTHSDYRGLVSGTPQAEHHVAAVGEARYFCRSSSAAGTFR